MKLEAKNRIEGLLLGTAVGDCLGLPMEGMKPSTIKKLGWSKNWKHRFIFGRGMWSDDTEHAIMLTQALLASDGDVDKFARKFGWELRWWLFGLPAGVGMATARAMIKLWLGFSPKHSGVFSAGNGAAMRTAIIATYLPDDADKRIEFVKAQTRITHSDPKAIIASVAVTEITARLLKSDSPPAPEDILLILKHANALDSILHDKEWNSILRAMEKGWCENGSLPDFLSSVGIKTERGISGYAYHTVPAVIYAGVLFDWDFQQVIPAIISAGGDTDSTATIAGALCGAFGGESSIPLDWVASIAEWPTGIKDLRVIARAVRDHDSLRIRPYWSPALLLRNILFLITVLVHGFSRLIPCALRRERCVLIFPWFVSDPVFRWWS